MFSKKPAATGLGSEHDDPQSLGQALDQAEIYRRGFTLSSLSEALSLSSTDIAVALSRRFPKADNAIAKWLGVELHILWPNRYAACGRLLRQQRQSSRRRRRHTSQNVPRALAGKKQPRRTGAKAHHKNCEQHLLSEHSA